MTWDEYYLGLANSVSEKSKDPSTKVGAVIVRPDYTLASIGFNGFPRGVKDLPERYADRETKYKLVAHAEANAIVTAREPLHGYTIYTTLPPCAECAKLIIQSGIRLVCTKEISVDRWSDSHRVADLMFEEAGVKKKIRTSSGCFVEKEAA